MKSRKKERNLDDFSYFLITIDVDVDDNVDLLGLVDLNNSEIHDDRMRNWLIVVEYLDVDNVDCDEDDCFDYYYDESIYTSSMKNSRVMTRIMNI
jgi:hypothetical protein